MPTLSARFLRAQLRLLKPFYNRFSIETTRAFQDRLGSVEARTVADKVDFVCADFERFDACFAYPKDGRQDGVVLYLHGGGYVAGGLDCARGFAGTLAAHIKRPVLGVAYRLAPEHPFPAALDDALEAYLYLRGKGEKRIALVGESAGGGLVFAMCLRLKELGLPLPDALVGISPWVDLTFSGGSYKTNKWKAPVLNERVLRGYAACYAPGQEEDPLVSPVLGDLCGLPPVLLFAGGDELLLSDAVTLSEKLRRCGTPCQLVVEKGLWHVYVFYKTHEAQCALNRIAAFLGDIHDNNA